MRKTKIFFLNVSNHRWSTCPSGHFLQGLYRGDGNNLHNIEYGKCCKPANHPYWWGSCYNQDIMLSFDKKGLSKCDDGYYMTGVYRGGCDGLRCIEEIKCCKMYPSKSCYLQEKIWYHCGETMRGVVNL